MGGLVGLGKGQEAADVLGRGGVLVASVTTNAHANVTIHGTCRVRLVVPGSGEGAGDWMHGAAGLEGCGVVRHPKHPSPRAVDPEPWDGWPTPPPSQPRLRAGRNGDRPRRAACARARHRGSGAVDGGRRRPRHAQA